MVLNRIYRAVIFLLSFLVCGQHTSAKEYATAELKTIADLLSKHPVPHKEVADNTTGKVVHLGYDLFDEGADEYSQMFQRFVERYALKLCLLPKKERETLIRNDKVEMDWGRISRLPKSHFCMVAMDSAKYSVSWMLCRVSFPKDFSLVSGLNKRESDYYFIDKVSKYNAQHQSDSIVSNIVSLPVDSATYCGRAGESYYIKEMTNSRYYVKVAKDSLMPIYNDAYPMETVSNLLLSLFEGEFRLNVEQNMYGYKKSSYEVSLSGLSEICRSEGCEPFVGIESVTEKEVKAMVLYRNEFLSYNHLLYVSFPIETIRAQRGELKATFYAYIPTSNLKELFKKR